MSKLDLFWTPDPTPTTAIGFGIGAVGVVDGEVPTRISSGAVFTDALDREAGLISTGDVVVLMGITRRTLHRWIRSGHFPPPTRGGFRQGHAAFWTLRTVLAEYRRRHSSKRSPYAGCRYRPHDRRHERDPDR